MSRPADITAGRSEKTAAGWFEGMNSVRSSWLLLDAQYQSGINIVNRGGIPQTRPGFAAQVSLPPGKLQGGFFFQPTKEGSTGLPYLVAAVSGRVYALPFPLVQPVDNNFTPYMLKNILFDSSADRVYFESGEKSVQVTSSGELTVVATYKVLTMQDNVNAAAYWDGVLNDHSNELQKGIPKGSWMKWVGNRMWVVRGTSVLASDPLDPLSFIERTQVDSDFTFDDLIVGLHKSSGDDKAERLVVGTLKNIYSVNASVALRENWVDGSTQMVKTVHPEVGVRAGASFVTYAGLLWWFDERGLLNSDIAAATYLTSKISYRDVEMARLKAGLSSDLSGICATTFDNCLLVSIPVNDTYNSLTMVLDSSVSDELTSETAQCWCGAWTGIRPVAYINATIDGVDRVFALSVDYVELDDSPNRVWELFQSDRRDSYETVTADNTRKRVYNQIFCEFETKAFGDGRDLKKFAFMEADLVQIGGTVNLKASFAGLRGGYHEILSKNMIATMDRTSDPEIQALYDFLGGFQLQGRHVSSQNATPERTKENVETPYDELVDSAFSILFQWCGRMGIDAVRVFMDPIDEQPGGSCEPEETGIRILTKDGKSILLPDNESSREEELAFGSSRFDFSIPIVRKYRESFYSSIPVSWHDVAGKEILCLPCARDTFTAPLKQSILVDGEVIY